MKAFYDQLDESGMLREVEKSHMVKLRVDIVSCRKVKASIVFIYGKQDELVIVHWIHPPSMVIVKNKKGDLYGVNIVDLVFIKRVNNY